MTAVALTPLMIVTGVSLHQHRQVFRSEAFQPISRLTARAKRSLESFLAERRAALTFIINDSSLDALSHPDELARIMAHLNRSMAVAAFVDLGIIDSGGNQTCYTGPFQLAGKNYADQDWFHQIQRRGVYVSDVFLGHRNLPHFAIAIKHATGDGAWYLLRATIDADTLREQIRRESAPGSADVFLVDDQGVLQTPSVRYGAALQSMPLAVPARPEGVDVREMSDGAGQEIIRGCAAIGDSPYLLMVVQNTSALMGSSDRLRSELLAFLAVSCLLILGVILWGSRQFVKHLREADHRRAMLLHRVEYANKLASIGRLAAGVAHEINNPLAIINEKAGLLKDLLLLEEEFPHRAKGLDVLDRVLDSVDRCKAITHRLLGFAKHMNVKHEAIVLPALLREVFSFLEKEASFREIEVSIEAQEGLPTITSDRGQLQQVFLNILNNAIAAVDDGGRIRMGVRRVDDGNVAATIQDDGVGIPADHLKQIFEPFYTTKEGTGSGLGLSVSYGIVQKLGGRIEVESEVGKGTTFTVVLPIET